MLSSKALRVNSFLDSIGKEAAVKQQNSRSSSGLHPATEGNIVWYVVLSSYHDDDIDSFVMVLPD